MADKETKGRFAWMAEEEKEDFGEPEVSAEARQGAAPSARAGTERISPSVPEGTYGAGAGTGVPGVARRRRNRPKDPNALRNDPSRMMAGARIRRDVRRRVDQALADGEVTGEGDTNYSLLVESLLLRWLEEVGYPMSGS